MSKILYAFITIMALASCGNSYNIQGSSNVSTLDGRMLYLKVLHDNDFKTIDSCDVVHGQFHFNGSFDSICMANIFMDDESVLPLVLEKGDITIKIDNTQQTVSGTPLNDELFKFFNRYNQLKNQEAELIHMHDRAIMDGSDMNAVNRRISAEAQRLTEQEDKLMVTIGYRYPELTPWIEDIMSKATDKFKNDPYVKDYYKKAQENQAIMNGMKTPEPAMSAPAQGPTPNELAAPAQ